jgi:hypothetical protein
MDEALTLEMPPPPPPLSLCLYLPLLGFSECVCVTHAQPRFTCE